MSDTSNTSNAGSAGHDAGHGAGHHTNYVKIWGILLALLVVSVVGPMIGIRWLTLVTAFGIAFVKATMVARYFMHIQLERKFVVYLCGGMLAFMLVMFAGISPDVLKHEGHHWDNVAAKAAVERGEKEGAAAEEAEKAGEKPGAEKAGEKPAEHH